MQRLTDPRLVFDRPPTTGEEKGVALKRIEDQVDAVACAYLTALAWLYGGERLEMIGTVTEGYVVVPREMATPLPLDPEPA